MTVLTIVGARPQFIKAFAVSRAIGDKHDEILVHTGQHYDEELSDVFFQELGLPEPAYNLAVGSDSHGAQTAAMVEGIESVVSEVDPNIVLLYGDTNSTLAGAIVGSKSNVYVCHVEAGLRSFDRDMPEEINRILTDHAADLLFAPTTEAVTNLAAEGITDGVHQTGDVMYDSLLWAKDRAKEYSTILEDLNIQSEGYVLSTVHRAGNTDDPDRLESIVNGLKTSSLPVIFPAHPRTIDRLDKYNLLKQAESNLRIIDPVSYLDFIQLLDNAERVMTDAGGVQKEAFFLDTSCVTLRESTEWIETVDCGWNKLVGSDSEAIKRALIENRQLSDKPTPYGDGNAAETIVKIIDNTFYQTR